MKNFIILGLTALLLFAISAALSMWLNQDRHAAESSTTEKTTDKTTKKSGEKADQEPVRRTESKSEAPLGTDPASLAALREQQRKLQDRTEQVNLILKDILVQKDANDVLIRQVLAELKNAEGRTGDLEMRAAELEKKKIDFDAAERKNIERIAGLLDAMAPESAAATLKQMSESGRLEVAAKVLALMKDRNAARALGELADPTLAAQLLDKMRMLKAAAPPVPAVPAPQPSGAIPAGGPVTPRPPAP